MAWNQRKCLGVVPVATIVTIVGTNRISAIVKNLDKCKSLTFTWDLHVVYTAIDTYTHNIG